MEDSRPAIAITVYEPPEGQEGEKIQVSRTLSDSSTDPQMSRDLEHHKGRSRSVNFFSGVEDNSEKRRLQRTPTPYWSRREMGDDTSAEEDGIGYTPNYDPPEWEDAASPSLDHLRVTSQRQRRPVSPSSSGDEASYEDFRATSNPNQTALESSPPIFDNKRKATQLDTPNNQADPSGGNPEVPELFLNPLFRKVAGLPGQVNVD